MPQRFVPLHWLRLSGPGLSAVFLPSSQPSRALVGGVERTIGKRRGGLGRRRDEREVVLSATLTEDGRAQEQLWTRLRRQVGVRSGRSGKEFESFGVGGANDPEVAFIGCASRTALTAR